MITRFASLTSRMAVLFAFLFTVAACGGGGSGGGGFLPEEDNESLYFSLNLYDPAGNQTNTVTTAAPGTLKVTVSRKNANGARVGNVVVTTETDIGLVIPASGTALTDSNGVATFTIEAGPLKGAGTITSSATDDGITYTASRGFQVGRSDLRLGYYADDGSFIENEISIQPGTTLASSGSAQLSVVILGQDGQRVITAEQVRFSSGCIAAGQAAINPGSPITSVNGQVSTTYTASGCAGTDQITASIVGASSQAFGSLDIAPATANAVTFVSAEPTVIVLRGTGGSATRQETSAVTFKVVDGNGNSLQGIKVDFSLSTEVGGLSVIPASALTDGNGQVTATVSSGDVATVVRVIADVDDGSGSSVSTVSDVLTVTTGMPDQDSISLSVSGGFVVENGFTQDGVTRTINVAMADKFNNPVIDGTAAVFTTEYGSIEGSCTTVNGTCSVEWRSQAPRFPKINGSTYVMTIYSPGYNCPSHNGRSGPCPDDLGYTRGGRSTILVHAIGEETFVDRNGNGVMDEAEKDLFVNLPEAFIDNNEDGAYTPDIEACQSAPQGSPQCTAGFEETYIDFNGNEQYDRNDNPAVYNGLLCPPEGDGVWCSRELVNVRDQTVVILSAGPDWAIILTRGGSVVTGTQHGATQIAYISDVFNSRPPEGSTVDVAAEGDCELLSESSFEVGNSAAYGAYSVAVVTGPAEPSDPPVPGVVNITLNPKDGSPFTRTFACDSSSITDPADCDFSPKPPGCPVDP